MAIISVDRHGFTHDIDTVTGQISNVIQTAVCDENGIITVSNIEVPGEPKGAGLELLGKSDAEINLMERVEAIDTRPEA